MLRQRALNTGRIEETVFIECAVSRKGPKAGAIYNEGITSIRRKPAGSTTPEAMIFCNAHL